MLARKRSAQLEHEIRRLVEERAERADPGLALQVEVPPRVHAALAVVAVQRAVVVVLLRDLAQAAEILAEALGRHRRVLPALVRVRLSRDERRRAEPCLAHLPDVLLLLGIVEELHALRRIGSLLQLRDEVVRLRIGLLLVLPAELDDEPALPLGHQLDVLGMHADRLHVLDQDVVDALETGRLVLEHLQHVVGCLVLAVPAEHEQGAVLRAVDQVHGRLEHGHAGSLRAGERGGDVEPLLGKEIVEVVAGDPARDVRVPLANQIGVPVGQISQARVDVRVAGRSLADGQPASVIQQHLELVDVLGQARAETGELRHDRTDAAGVVPDHPAERAVIVRRRIRPERQLMVALGRLPQVVEDQPGLHARELPFRVEVEDAVQVLREIEHDGDVAALAGEARAAPARKERRFVLPADADSLDDVVERARNDDADRQLAVVRAAGGVERPIARPESHLPLDGAAEVVLEAADVYFLEGRRRRGEAAVGVGRDAHQAA